MKKNYKPTGRCRVLNITKISEKEGIKDCPKCNELFVFDNDAGTFSCKKCGMFGGVRKLLKLSVEQNGRYI